VPQGSVLGPLQFISYTDDVTSAFDKRGVKHHLFADDKQGYTDVPPNDVDTDVYMTSPLVSAAGVRLEGYRKMRRRLN